MKKLFAVLLLFSAALSFAQQNSAPQKYALVIGNGAYTNVTKLNNPVNDANDMEAALKGLGWTVEKVLNGNITQMENGIMNLKKRLKGANNSYGFFFYAGHGVQSGGENYLIPVDANIQSESFLRRQSISVQEMLDELNDAGNELNIVVLDACRDNPFPWKRSGSRGLQVVGNQPADSIIVFATSAGSTAADGTGRNGLFTGELLKNLKTSGLEVAEVFRLTMGDVVRASGSQQRPAVYNQFSGTAYLGTKPAAQTTVQQPPVFEQGTVSVATGSLEISTVTAGTVEISGGTVNRKTELPAWGSLPIAKINAGNYRVIMRYADGKVEEKTIEVGRNESKKLEFSYRPAPQSTPQTTTQPAARPETPAPNNFVRINGGTFTMGSPANEPGREDDEGPLHQVTVSGFSMGKYPVTVGEFRRFVNATGYRTDAEKGDGGYVWTNKWEKKADANWKNPYINQGENHPVVQVSWNDAVQYCNWLSGQEKLTAAYTINGTNATLNKNASGYRLPTEAEWEYACRAGTTTRYWSGSDETSLAGKANVADLTAKEKHPDWTVVNIRDGYAETSPVGSFASNPWGLYDMHGNVWEWCWDWYDSNYYSSSPKDNPVGASSGSSRVNRGGSWYDYGGHVRSAFRGYNTPSYRYNILGFRLVCP